MSVQLPATPPALARRAAVSAALLLALGASRVRAQDPVAPPAGDERVLLVDLLENGDFEESWAEYAPEASRLPWWTVHQGPVELVEDGGERRLRIGIGSPGSTYAFQRVPGYAPLLGGVEIRGQVRGRGAIEVFDGGSGRARIEVQGSFSIPGAELAAQLGHPPVPRLLISLYAAPLSTPEWSAVQVLVPLPLPTREALRAEILAHLDEVFGWWFERGIDLEGPRATGFACHAIDVVTGERLFSFPGGVFDLWKHVSDALEVHEDPVWRAHYEQFVASYLELIPHPDTGLPRRWDCERDEPLDGRWVEIGADLGLLVDLAERGPDRFRAPARAAAVRMAETVLRIGVLPDGSIAPKYRAGEAAASTAAPPLRRLDVPAQLARLAALTGDERYLTAARNAVAELEFTHDWPGTWDHIDPGFDDDYGHYGARAVTMLRAHPGDAAFRALAVSGFGAYAPLWRDALRLGGNVAADQVRCWRSLAQLAEIEPGIASELRTLMPMAVRAHFKGQQYTGGAWGDVTHARFDPQPDLQVGDLTGVPATMLWGLGIAADPALGLPEDEVRAMFTAVLRSTVTAYRRPFGYLRDRRELAGPNRSGGELRLCTGLIEMLRRL